MAKVTASTGQIESFLTHTRAMDKALRAIGDEVRDQAEQNARRDAYATGKMAGALKVVKQFNTMRVVSPVLYSSAVEGGWGKFGPKHKAIKRAGGKPFAIRLGGAEVWVKEIKGAEGTHFLTNAAVAVCARSKSLRWRPRNRWAAA